MTKSDDEQKRRLPLVPTTIGLAEDTKSKVGLDAVPPPPVPTAVYAKPCFLPGVAVLSVSSIRHAVAEAAVHGIAPPKFVICAANPMP